MTGFEKFKKITGDAYNKVAEIVDAWCVKNGYDDMIVSLAVNGEIKTEYLICNLNIPGGWEWENDWWEGEKDVRLLGFRPISMIHVYGEPGKGNEVIAE